MSATAGRAWAEGEAGREHASSTATEAARLPFDELLGAERTTACCAAVYEHPAVRWLLDDRLHPGGAELTRRTAELAGIEAGDRVLDVASGSGASAILLAEELGCEVVGIDAGEQAVAGAMAAAEASAAAGRISFRQAEAERLPFDDCDFDAVLCECSLCTFRDMGRAASEVHRVLRPGGRAALSDVTADPDLLPEPLRGAGARIACLAGALPLSGYEAVLRDAGLEPVRSEAHDRELAEMAERVEARLRVARMIDVPALEPFRDDLDAARELARLALKEIEAGRIGYSIFVARAPG